LAAAREHVAALVATSPEHIMFTSSGSEANVAAVRSALNASNRRVVVTSEIEHASLRQLWTLITREGYQVRFARTLPSGEIDMNHLSDLVDDDVALLCVQLVNNETGVIQPVADACRRASAMGAVVVVDAAQAIGKMEFSPASIGADYVSFTGHKFHAPAGVGALYSRREWDGFVPLVTGGSQESGVRGGTHNVLGITALGEAARVRSAHLSEAISHMQQLRDVFEESVLSSVYWANVNGDATRVCNTVNVRFGNIDGKALFAQLSDAGIECSQSSACTAAYPEPSHVLRAMGLSYHEAFSSIRFSFSVQNTIEEAREAAQIVVERAKMIESVLGGVW
jgi:cysteine desulfurase